MNDFGITKIGVYTPDDAIDAFELGERLQADADFIREKIGFAKLSRKASGEEASDLCVKSFEDLLKQSAIDLGSIDCVVVVTQNPDGGGIPHSSVLVHHKLGLPSRTACFDISLGCTGYVHSLSVMSGFLRENQMETGLLFTADPYSRIIDPDNRDTALLFGDAASCTLITRSPRYRLGRTNYVTASQYAQAICVPKRSASLQMNGNQVFRFVAKNAPRQIKQCLELNGVAIEEVKLFLAHQGSRYIINTLAAGLGVARDRVPFDESRPGNSVSSTLPIMLKGILSAEPAPQHLILAGFGVGLSSAVTLITRNPQ